MSVSSSPTAPTTCGESGADGGLIRADVGERAAVVGGEGLTRDRERASEVLNAIYETDFLGFSYGFRSGRSPHHALDALSVGIDAEAGELGARRGHPRLLGCRFIMPPEC